MLVIVSTAEEDDEDDELDELDRLSIRATEGIIIDSARTAQMVMMATFLNLLWFLSSNAMLPFLPCPPGMHHEGTSVTQFETHLLGTGTHALRIDLMAVRTIEEDLATDHGHEYVVLVGGMDDS